MPSLIACFNPVLCPVLCRRLRSPPRWSPSGSQLPSSADIRRGQPIPQQDLIATYDDIFYFRYHVPLYRTTRFLRYLETRNNLTVNSFRRFIRRFIPSLHRRLLLVDTFVVLLSPYTRRHVRRFVVASSRPHVRRFIRYTSLRPAFR